ncbi:MAG: glycosyltransferase family 1 protein [Rubritalea sp.]|uniref:glycosyltransferase family 4 protein n=1 Tax=Rubritalea sp. TaxID=2109375 RepID=UPI003242AFCB
MLTIGFESKRLLTSSTGFGTYSRTLIRDIYKFYPETRCVLIAHDSYKVLKKLPTFSSSEVRQVRDLDSIKVVYPPSSRNLYWKLLGAKRTLYSQGIDIYHGLAHQIPRSVRQKRVPIVVTVHDLIYRHYPEFSPDDDHKLYESQLINACSISDKIIAVSESTKRDIVNIFSISPKKISVIYSACDYRYHKIATAETIQQTKSNYGLPERYLLYVGSMSERKNLLSVVKALNIIPRADRLPLVVVGAKTSYSNVIGEYIKNNGLDSWIIFPKRVETEDLPAVYQAADIFLYTSLYEGFGMPILEALTSGIPVITSNVSAMPEAAGPDSRLIDPESPDEIASSIIDILSDDSLRRKMVKNGHSYAQKFDNKIITEQMLQLYQSTILNHTK